MKSLRRLCCIIALLAVTVACLPRVEAGGSADSRVGTEKYGDESIRRLALQVNEILNMKQVNLAIVARSGRPRSELPKGISFTHVAFIVFEPVADKGGQVSHTYTVYNLYQGAEGRDDRSYLKQDFTYDFVAGTAERDIGVCVPTDDMQKRLIGVIRSPAYVALHNPEYNLLTNPWVDRFDNCVSHSLKLCMAAIYQTDDRARIYRNNRAHFKPTPVKLGPVQGLGSRFMSAVSREDMDSSGFQTASYDSLTAFLAENGLVKETFVVAMN